MEGKARPDQGITPFWEGWGWLVNVRRGRLDILIGRKAFVGEIDMYNFCVGDER